MQGQNETNQVGYLKNTKRSIVRPPVMRLVVTQLMLTVTVGILFLTKGTTSAYSALLGGLIFALPNAYFAQKAFAHSGARSAQLIVKSFYMGEAVKLILTAVLFTIVFVSVKPLDVMALFLTFFVILMSNWLTPWVFSHKPQQN
jgi:ATP synthase protein I